jgi:hypothetical protein
MNENYSETINKNRGIRKRGEQSLKEKLNNNNINNNNMQKLGT